MPELAASGLVVAPAVLAHPCGRVCRRRSEPVSAHPKAWAQAMSGTAAGAGPRPAHCRLSKASRLPEGRPWLKAIRIVRLEASVCRPAFAGPLCQTIGGQAHCFARAVLRPAMRGLPPAVQGCGAPERERMFPVRLSCRAAGRRRHPASGHGAPVFLQVRDGCPSPEAAYSAGSPSRVMAAAFAAAAPAGPASLYPQWWGLAPKEGLATSGWTPAPRRRQQGWPFPLKPPPSRSPSNCYVFSYFEFQCWKCRISGLKIPTFQYVIRSCKFRGGRNPGNSVKRRINLVGQA